MAKKKPVGGKANDAAKPVGNTVKKASTVKATKAEKRAVRQGMREAARANREAGYANFADPMINQVPWGNAGNNPPYTPQPQSSPPPADPPDNDPPPATTGDTAARRELARYIRNAGFPDDMLDFFLDKMTSGELPEDADEFEYLDVASQHPSFQTRFPVIVEQLKKRKAGDMSVQVMSPNAVLDYEKQLRKTADDYGLSAWVSSPEQISKLILNGVDVDEARERINLAGYAASSTTPAAFREAFLGRHGLTEGNLVGYFLDPDKEEAEIRKQVSLGNVMGAAISNGFGNNWSIAERLYNRGFIPAGEIVGMSSVMSDFARAALTSSLSQGLGGTVNEEQRIDAAFGDSTAATDVAKVAAERTGRFNRSGGAVEGRTGVAGLGVASTT